MFFNIDWISFTIKDLPVDDNQSGDMLNIVAERLVNHFPTLAYVIAEFGEFTPQNGRAPYSHSWYDSRTKMRIFTHPRLPHASIEMSGTTCDWLKEKELLLRVLGEVATSLTRLDVACDILTETRPTDFAKLRDGERFKSHSEVVSQSGETCYIGAKTSDRYARVYRYNPPHERSKLLRVEYVLKADNAKQTASYVLSQGIEAAAAALGSTFGWKHPDWNTRTQPAAEIPVIRPERREGKTLFWLASQVAPVLVRLAKAGVIDPHMWLDTYVISKLQSPPDE